MGKYNAERENELNESQKQLAKHKEANSTKDMKIK